MSNVDLKEFVNINIIRHATNAEDNIRDTVVLYTSEKHKANIVDGQDTYTGIISSMTEASFYFDYEVSETPQAPNTLKYLSMYFNNGGIKVKVVEYDEPVYDTGENIVTYLSEQIHELDNKYICIAIIYPSNVYSYDDAYLNSKNIAITLNGITQGIDEKLILSRNTAFSDTDKVKNFVVKYSTDIGAEMTIAAYLSKIDVYGLDTVYDYAFTEEKINDANIDTITFKTLMENNYNVDIELSGTIRNCGGNCKNGEDIVNQYVLIILHQTLTNVLLDVLSQKLKDSKGISKIYSAISQELEKYLNCGYLSTDKIWTYDDYVVNKEGVNYTIIEKGTPLVKGYSITVLPFSSLTENDKKNRLAPEVYVVLADQYGIRKIIVRGEVF